MKIDEGLRIQLVKEIFEFCYEYKFKSDKVEEITKLIKKGN